MSGGGKFYRKKTSFSNCLLKIRLFFKRLTKSLHKSRKIGNSAFRAPNFGGILIEFAFSVPVLIILMFFVLDHYRYYELQSKVKTSAYLLASLIQQLGNTRTNKQLSCKDLGMIAYASCLNFFHGKTMFQPLPFGVYYSPRFNWVKRINENSYQYQQSMVWGTADYSSSSFNYKSSNTMVSLTTRTKSQIAALHPDLICDNDGDERVLVLYYYWAPSGLSKVASKLGFFIMRFKNDNISDTDLSKVHFKYQFLFTPKPGLFPVTN